MSGQRPLTHGQYGDDDSAQGTFEQKTNREPTSNLLQERVQQQANPPTLPSPSPPSVSAGFQGGHDHPTSLHSTLGATLRDEGEIGDRTVQEASYSPLPSPSTPIDSARPPHSQHARGGQDHPTTHHSNAALRDEGKFGGLADVDELRMELQKEKKLLKKVKDEAESELAAVQRREEAAQRREEAALREKEAALREKEAALREKEAALREKEDAQRREEAAQRREEAAASQLDAERKAKDEAVKKLKTVVAEINSDATLQARRRRADATATSVEPLDHNNPMVRKFGANVLSQNTTINNCRSDVSIHEEPQVLLEALLSNQTKVGKMLFQKVIEEGVAYWSFMVGATKCCDLLLRMQVVRQDEEEVVVRVESVDEEELESASLPNPHSTASKKFRLLLKDGTIVLRPLQFGQTSLTFMAQVDVGEVMKDAVVASSPSAIGSTAVADENSRKGAAVKKLGAGGEAAKGDKLFSKLAEI
ncbi:hypothetical protein TrVE_jg7395 [Triparma verrucosa]|uniref:Uncharacterized protein n=1 Tax=Triparma verrucosa TaxID=1606542 RepID=A0A9W7KS92_9STRA|nr:hypothetical protein TrVE_jg7395 [Triparma verrucosa]